MVAKTLFILFLLYMCGLINKQPRKVARNVALKKRVPYGACPKTVNVTHISLHKSTLPHNTYTHLHN